MQLLPQQVRRGRAHFPRKNRLRLRENYVPHERRSNASNKEFLGRLPRVCRSFEAANVDKTQLGSRTTLDVTLWSRVEATPYHDRSSEQKRPDPNSARSVLTHLHILPNFHRAAGNLSRTLSLTITISHAQKADQLRPGRGSVNVLWFFLNTLLSFLLKLIGFSE